ncbi:serine hydrolase [Actinocatenispora thailandica]|uniref:Serine hydrolase n=2 Tax=Actinocatenispora thailandica TaxID=227318 RepID=A0A7R7HYL6_9ACTN|nr:serine hydrolase [Actinocatenispora thailandica]
MQPTPVPRRNLRRRSLLGLLGAVPVTAAGVGALTGDTGADAQVAARPVPRSLRPGGTLDRAVRALADQGKFSGTLLLVDGHRTVLSRSYGKADQARNIANGPDTMFALGSVTKLFTAVAVAQLAARGRVDYHQTLGTYLGGFPSTIADTVTLHQLLTHTSGMGDYHALDGYAAALATWTSTEAVLSGTLDFIRAAPLAFTPGTRHQYSNSGYTVLGGVVAAVTGQSYYDYVAEHVFAAAGMTRTAFVTRPRWKRDRGIAHPYAGGTTDVLDQRGYVGLPDGDAFSTVPDLVRFVRALRGHRLLDAADTDLLTGPKFPVAMLPPKDGKPLQAMFEAYGPEAARVGDRWEVGHTGGSTGITANLEWYPRTGYVLGWLCNTDARELLDLGARARLLLTAAN